MKKHILVYGGKTSKPQPSTENCCRFFKDESYLSEQSFQKEIIKMTEK